MTSTNEELPPPLKTRTSPVEYQNADLVSRLLAATPPYLYNMPVVPHSFFFSEMLRSLVQAKASENAQRQGSSTLYHRRARKRSWTQAHSDVFNKDIQKPENVDVFQPMWNKNFPEKSKPYEEKPIEKPPQFPSSRITSNDRVNCDEGLGENKNFLYPDFQKSVPSTSASIPPSNQTQSLSDLTLPSTSSVWYPSLYSGAYGIDPLHFFIDLRVSGHIYDKKSQKEGLNLNLQSQTASRPPFPQPAPPPSISSNHSYKPEPSSEHSKEVFKQSRHTSAFSVPKSVLNRNLPVNLTQYNSHRDLKEGTETKVKFDVKSMGLDKSENKTGTSYIMKNVTTIYRSMYNNVTKTEVESVGSETQEQVDIVDVQKDPNSQSEEEAAGDEEKEKRVKDLRALIGLELVVDYMNSSKPVQQSEETQDSSSDLGSSDSPALDVVDIHDDVGTVY